MPGKRNSVWPSILMSSSQKQNFLSELKRCLCQSARVPPIQPFAFSQNCSRSCRNRKRWDFKISQMFHRLHLPGIGRGECFRGKPNRRTWRLRSFQHSEHSQYYCLFSDERRCRNLKHFLMNIWIEIVFDRDSIIALYCLKRDWFIWFSVGIILNSAVLLIAGRQSKRSDIW